MVDGYSSGGKRSRHTGCATILQRRVNALLCETREADSTCTGCWASSGYSVQGCAQLEQKLRQCMDAPVGPPSTNTARIADHPSALRTRRRTTSTTIFPGCIPRSRVPTSGIDSVLPADRTLYIISIPTATCPRPNYAHLRSF
jgi:hypothetical protein